MLTSNSSRHACRTDIRTIIRSSSAHLLNIEKQVLTLQTTDVYGRYVPQADLHNYDICRERVHHRVGRTFQ